MVDTTFPLFSPSGSRVVAPALLVGESMQLMPIIETGLVGAECQQHVGVGGGRGGTRGLQLTLRRMQ